MSGTSVEPGSGNFCGFNITYVDLGQSTYSVMAFMLTEELFGAL